MLEENRNCGCMMHQHNNPNIVAYTAHNNNSMNSCEFEEFNQTREEMMNRIQVHLPDTYNFLCAVRNGLNTLPTQGENI